MIQDIFNKYKDDGRPAICEDGNDMKLNSKILAGEPTSKTRATLRSQCNPQGPVGYMLESVHLQAAMMDTSYKIHQHNQPSVDTMEVPYQHLAPMVRQLCCRNRTKAAANSREETQDLYEIDTEATDAGKMSDEDKLILDLVRTGAAWTSTAAYWAGQADSKVCERCGEGDERSWHFWTCTKLKKTRSEANEKLAKLDPTYLPMPFRHGTAPCHEGKGHNNLLGDRGPEARRGGHAGAAKDSNGMLQVARDPRPHQR